MRLGQAHLERTRKKIQTSMLLKRLENHALGKIELTAQQVQSIKILLSKTMPDLKAMEFTGEVETTPKTQRKSFDEMSDAELKEFIANSDNVSELKK